MPDKDKGDGSSSGNPEANLNDSLVPFSPSDISVCHLVAPKNPNKIPQIIVRFVSRASVQKVLAVKKKLRRSTEYQNVYIQEDLTALRMILFDVENTKEFQTLTPERALCTVTTKTIT